MARKVLGSIPLQVPPQKTALGDRPVRLFCKCFLVQVLCSTHGIIETDFGWFALALCLRWGVNPCVEQGQGSRFLPHINSICFMIGVGFLDAYQSAGFDVTVLDAPVEGYDEDGRYYNCVMDTRWTGVLRQVLVPPGVTSLPRADGGKGCKRGKGGKGGQGGAITAGKGGTGGHNRTSASSSSWQ